MTPRGLIMSLFNAPDTSMLTIGQLIKAGALFEIEATAIRMTASRLIKDKLIESHQRGVYRAGEKATRLNSEIQSWRNTDKKVSRWNGHWMLALTNHLGRTNKAQLRSMTRAFHLYGFTEVELGVWLRPANLVQNINQVSDNLIEIGMDSGVHLMVVSEVAGKQQTTWCANWPINELQVSYSKMISKIKASLTGLNDMNNQDAAKETLIIGQSAIRLINLDPLLPNEFINTELFETVVELMIAYDKVGQTYWQRFLSN